MLHTNKSREFLTNSERGKSVAYKQIERSCKITEVEKVLHIYIAYKQIEKSFISVNLRKVLQTNKFGEF